MGPHGNRGAGLRLGGEARQGVRANLDRSWRKGQVYNGSKTIHGTGFGFACTLVNMLNAETQ